MNLQIFDYNAVKERFTNEFKTIVNSDDNLRSFIYEYLIHGTAYVVGGFLRDIFLNQKSRDLDMILSLSFTEITKLLNESGLKYTLNRMNGFKITTGTFEIDLWCIDDNWAFKNKLVVKNEEYILESIGNGCFYNYDSLVINVHTNNLNIRHYKDFVNSRKLDIIQKKTAYKKMNPTVEANILRAFYLRQIYNIDFTENCNNYLLSSLKDLEDKFTSVLERLMDYKVKYAKYNKVLSEAMIQENIKFCSDKFSNNSTQKTIEF